MRFALAFVRYTSIGEFILSEISPKENWTRYTLEAALEASASSEKKSVRRLIVSNFGFPDSADALPSLEQVSHCRK